MMRKIKESKIGLWVLYFSRKKSQKGKKNDGNKKKDEEVKIEESTNSKSTKQDEKEKLPVESKSENEPIPENNEKKFKCTTCKDACFETNALFKTHFKSEWHNFNVKRKVDVTNLK